MAQLVKLQDYISRYQIDLKRYPTQFVRLKKLQWEQMKEQWESGQELVEWKHEEVEETKKSLARWMNWFPFSKKKSDTKWSDEEFVEEEMTSETDVSSPLEEEIPEEVTTLLFEPNIVYQPQTIEELKRMYIDQLFHFQLKWASSTLREKSYVDPKYTRDSLLRAFTQKLPDSYLLFYYPILQLKKAPVEMEVVLLTPTECLCIHVLEEENQAAFIGSGDRFWTKKVGKGEKKVLSPIISLNRMESILTQLFKQDEVELPVRKIVLSRNGYIDYPGSTYGVQLIDKRKFPEWFLRLKKALSPMKHMQFKAAQSILNVVQTTSYQRIDWETTEEDSDK